jgi:transposase InsO family protein
MKGRPLEFLLLPFAGWVNRCQQDVIDYLKLENRTLREHLHSPNLNAYAERFVLSIKSECLNKLMLLGERHLRRAVKEFVEHYHLERNHQGLDSRLLTAPTESRNNNVPVTRRERLGGLLSYYYRRAA